MRKLANIVAWTLALNFIALAGAVAWLYRQGYLNRQKVTEIRQILFPAPSSAGPATRPAESPSTRPALRLEELLAQYAGRPPAEQLEYIRRSFDAQMAQLDQARGVMDLQAQVLVDKKKLTDDRAGLEDEKKKLLAREQQADRAATDKGLQDTLALYQTLPARQAKAIFMSLDDATVVQYLQAMEPRGRAHHQGIQDARRNRTPQETHGEDAAAPGRRQTVNGQGSQHILSGAAAPVEAGFFAYFGCAV